MVQRRSVRQKTTTTTTTTRTTTTKMATATKKQAILHSCRPSAAGAVVHWWWPARGPAASLPSVVATSERSYYRVMEGVEGASTNADKVEFPTQTVTSDLLLATTTAKLALLLAISLPVAMLFNPMEHLVLDNGGMLCRSAV